MGYRLLFHFFLTHLPTKILIMIFQSLAITPPFSLLPSASSLQSTFKLLHLILGPGWSQYSVFEELHDTSNESAIRANELLKQESLWTLAAIIDKSTAMQESGSCLCSLWEMLEICLNRWK